MKNGTIERRLTHPMHKDDTEKSRVVSNFSSFVFHQGSLLIRMKTQYVVFVDVVTSKQVCVTVSP